jgi:hypothetical protein
MDWSADAYLSVSLCDYCLPGVASPQAGFARGSQIRHPQNANAIRDRWSDRLPIDSFFKAKYRSHIFCFFIEQQEDHMILEPEFLGNVSETYP